MDELDRRILTALQEAFPLAADPYETLAAALGLSVDALWERVRRLCACGAIRRIGLSIDSRKIGFTSTLAAIRVPDGQVETARALMERYPQITHSYLRDDAFNIWFTVIAENAERIQAILAAIRRELGLEPEAMMDLPAERFFKLDTRFKS